MFLCMFISIFSLFHLSVDVDRDGCFCVCLLVFL